MSGTLYIVATPIGNLGDLTLRVIETLKSVDFIAAEDTRVTAKILNHLNIKKPMLSYHEHNEQHSAQGILARIEAGESCALCSDAGTPAISDPGEAIVIMAHAQDIKVVPIPAQSAAIAALSVSGQPTGRFCFEGFLPMNKKQRVARLEEIKNERRTLIFYEAPHKLLNTLKDLCAALGDRSVTIAREITKMHEHIEKTTLSAAAQYYSAQAPRGEFVLVIAGAPVQEAQPVTIESALQLAKDYAAQGLAASAACKKAAEQTGRPKSEIYKAFLTAQEK